VSATDDSLMSDTPAQHPTVLAHRQTQKSPSFCAIIDTPEGLSILIFREKTGQKNAEILNSFSAAKNSTQPPASPHPSSIRQPSSHPTPIISYFSFLLTPHTGPC
jgi:hypothetical protein